MPTAQPTFITTRKWHPNAIATVVKQVYSSVFRTVRRWCVSKEDAEDLVQDSIAVALGKDHCPREPIQLQRWLIAIARFLFRNQLRRRRIQSPKDIPIDTLELLPGGSPVQTMPAYDLALDLRIILGQLASEDRRMLLETACGYRIEEIRQRSGRSLSGQKMRLVRVRTLMRGMGTTIPVKGHLLLAEDPWLEMARIVDACAERSGIPTGGIRAVISMAAQN